jgi:hypothetical protein
MLALLGSATAYRPAMAPSSSTAPHRALAPTMQLHSRRTAIKGAASLLVPSAAALFQAPGVAVAADPIWSITEPDFASATTTLLAAKTLSEYLTETEAEGGAPQITDAARKAAALNEERAKAREEQLKLQEERRASLAARAEEAAEERKKALEEAKVAAGEACPRLQP